MGIILAILACMPLLGLEPLRWHHHHGTKRLLPKAFWLAFSASVFWSWFSDYISAAYVGWDWLFYFLMAAGAAFSGYCHWKAYEKRRSRLGTASVVLAFVFVYVLTAASVSDMFWLGFRGPPQRIQGLSAFQLGLRR